MKNTSDFDSQLEKEWEADNPDFVIRNYRIPVSHEILTRTFTFEEVQFLRPIAEVIALLDGNILHSTDIYELYITDAYALYIEAGGDLDRKTGELKIFNNEKHENENIKDAWEAWMTLKKLSKE